MKKILFSLVLALALTVFQVGAVFAQDATTPTSVTGTVDSVELTVDATTGDTTVTVTLTDADGNTQTVDLTVDEAVTLGLVAVDETTGEPSVVDESVGSEVTVDLPADTGGEDTATGDEHPVGSELADFFEDTGVDYDAIMEMHNDGAGFGVIAQALAMTEQMGGDAELFQAIMEAKMSHDFSSLTLEDGSTPRNWGELRKAVLGKGGGKDKSVGAAMSKGNKPEDKGGKPDDKGNGKPDDKGGKPDDKGNGKDGKGGGKGKP